MSKELEALERLKEYNKFDNIRFDMTKELEIIEPALKTLETIRKYCYISRKNTIPQKDYDLLERVLKEL